MEALPIVLILLVAVAGFVGSIYLRRARRQAFAHLAARLGWEYAPADPFGLLRLPFSVLRRGKGRGVENVLWGARGADQIKVFDYWYYTESVNSKGMRSRSYSRFTCGALPLGAECPETTIGPESVLSRLADFVGFGDIDFESEEFNRAMQVRSADRRFASYLIDARMMDWLLANRRWSFSVSGGWLLAVSSKLAPARIPAMIDALAGFRSMVPDVVFQTYGRR